MKRKVRLYYRNYYGVLAAAGLEGEGGPPPRPGPHSTFPRPHLNIKLSYDGGFTDPSFDGGGLKVPPPHFYL